MTKVDALGQACPVPVIRTKKALREADNVEVWVDNKIATQNLSKMAEQLGYQFEISQEAEKEYKVLIRKDGASSPTQTVGGQSEGTVAVDTSYAVVIDNDMMGGSSDGNVELGQNLMKSFVSSLLEQDVLPNEVIFYNGGVKLAVKDSDVLEDLQELESKGVSIFACGLCLDYYGITEDIAVGTITNMYAIVAMIRERINIVKP